MNYTKESLTELLEETVKCCKLAPLKFILKKILNLIPAKVPRIQWIQIPDNYGKDEPTKNDLAIFVHPETGSLCYTVYKGGDIDDPSNFYTFNEVENIPKV